MKSGMRLQVVVLAVAALLMSMLTRYARFRRAPDGLATPESFAAIDDPRRGRRHCSPSSAKC